MSESVTNKAGELQGLMVLLASLSNGLESTLGRGASTITFRAGRTIGLRHKTASATSDPIEALKVLDQTLRASGIEWPFEVWKEAGRADPYYEKDGKKMLRLVFHHCMVRCSLFRYAHEQKLSLCMMNHGLFCGYYQAITGKRADLDIVHAGDSACLKELVLHE